MNSLSDGRIKDELDFPEWQEPVVQAFQESDLAKLNARVAAAEAAIAARQHALSNDSNHGEERHAIENALAMLRMLKRESARAADGSKP